MPKFVESAFKTGFKKYNFIVSYTEWLKFDTEAASVR